MQDVLSDHLRQIVISLVFLHSGHLHQVLLAHILLDTLAECNSSTSTPHISLLDIGLFIFGGLVCFVLILGGLWVNESGRKLVSIDEFKDNILKLRQTPPDFK